MAPPSSAPLRHGHLRVVDGQDAAPLDDATLVAGVRAGLPGAAGMVWDRHSAMVRRILQRTLGPTADVEDATQEAFLRLFRDLASLRDPAALRSYLIGVTLNVARSELRRRRARRWLFLSDDGLAPEDADPVSPADMEARAALVGLYRLLDRLSAERRLVFVLRYVEGLELTELATVLGCSLATAKRRVADAAGRVAALAEAEPLLRPYLGGQR